MSDDPLFRRPDGRPLPENHHLSKNPRGKYVLRLTVSSEGAKIVGRRLVQQLRTRDPKIALEKRDTVIEAFKIMGMVCRDVEIMEEGM